MRFEKTFIILLLGLFIISCASENMTGEARLAAPQEGQEQLELAQGEATTVTLDGIEYEVYAALIADDSSIDRDARGAAYARIAVNGELSDELSQGETHYYENDARVQIAKLDTNNVALTISAEPERDQVSFELEEGETQSYALGNSEYEVTIAQANPNVTRIAVNGEMSPHIQSGGVHEYDNGAEVSVQGINDPVVAGLLSAPIMPPSDEVSDVISIDDTKTYELEGQAVELGYVYHNEEENTVRVSINGEVSDNLAEGDSYLTQGSTRIGFTLDEILSNSQESVIAFTIQVIVGGGSVEYAYRDYDSADAVISLQNMEDGSMRTVAVNDEVATLISSGVEYDIFVPARFEGDFVVVDVNSDGSYEALAYEDDSFILE